MTPSFEQDQLPPTLRAAELELASRLREACSRMQVSDESTGELMRLEDTLLDAARAAKQAVSVRRRLRSRAEAARESIAAPALPAADAADAEPTLTPGESAPASAEIAEVAVRNLMDPSGVEWQIWEVTPSAITRTGAVLSDYRDGWLAFESADGTRHKRLPAFPRDWTKLANPELEQLLERADEVKRKVRSRVAPARPASPAGEASSETSAHA